MPAPHSIRLPDLISIKQRASIESGSGGESGGGGGGIFFSGGLMSMGCGIGELVFTPTVTIFGAILNFDLLRYVCRLIFFAEVGPLVKVLISSALRLTRAATVRTGIDFIAFILPTILGEGVGHLRTCRE